MLPTSAALISMKIWRGDALPPQADLVRISDRQDKRRHYHFNDS